MGILVVVVQRWELLVQTEKGIHICIKIIFLCCSSIVIYYLFLKEIFKKKIKKIEMFILLKK